MNTPLRSLIIERPMTFAEKMLPNQPQNLRLYQGDDAEEALHRKVCELNGLDGPANGLDLEVPRSTPLEHMASTPAALRLLQMLVRSIDAKSILEIGTYVGVSAIHMALAMKQGGKLITIERGREFCEIAVRNVTANGLGHIIDVRHGDARSVLWNFLTPFDLVFIDGGKEFYGDYLRTILTTMQQWKSGSMIIIDDALFHGDVLNETPTTDAGRGVAECLEIAKGLGGWHRTMLPIANGMLILQKA